MPKTNLAAEAEGDVATADLGPTGSGVGVGQRAAQILGKYGALIALALVVVIFTIASPQYFLTWSNVLQILNQSALGAIIACGLTLVLVAGQFDLSVGYQASLAGIVCTTLMLKGVPTPLAILICLIGGGVAGVINAFLITTLRLNALVATLGSGSVVVGMTYYISRGVPQVVGQNNPGFLKISIGNWLGVPRPVYYMVLVAAVLWVVLNKTDFGRNLRAVGGNVEAAGLAGVRVSRVTAVSFVAAGVSAAVTGVLLASSVGSGQVTGGDNYTLASFAAAFLGSTVIKEGQFHIVGTLVGVITVAAGFNGLALVGVPSYIQFFFQGLLLIAAVGFSGLGRRLSRS